MAATWAGVEIPKPTANGRSVVAQSIDGVIIGSAFVDATTGRHGADAAAAARAYVEPLRAALELSRKPVESEGIRRA